ncbi:MAG: sulfurtransferase-like selenium metabolism protein YedF [Actinobacteria bacterium]|nr:sulfurtransferase-like selenium metabolism protein YedF [Actinomycetota bacterium]MBU1943127.1 sulfurtransferase-like selenium metabolism protein YedF [Actinomycetota bacterium]MBU2687926.1 sulfurtransferase-like selenium metabolism protein YedF [Actinomycetota bacterium]
MNGADVDARGLRCPEPVLRTRKRLAETPGAFTVLVDNPAARDNVRRFAQTSGCSVEVVERDGEFLVSITPGEGAGPVAAEKPCPASAGAACTPAVLLITSDELGTGSHELGATLIKSFLYACAQGDDVPGTVILMNGGVKLATENDETVEHLLALCERGCEVLACGTCLDYFGLADRLRAGRVSNMYEIQSKLVGAPRMLSL